MTHSSGVEAFLARLSSFGGWRDVWIGVPLEFRVFLGEKLPARELVGSVRAMVFRGDDVLLVHSKPPILCVGGRCEPGETIDQTLRREVAEECGWRVEPFAVLGFIHGHHLDDQRPEWGRPAPDFIDPLFAVTAVEYNAALLGAKETPSELVPIAEVERYGIDEINRTFLREALRKRRGKAPYHGIR